MSANIKKIIEGFSECKLYQQNDCSDIPLIYRGTSVGIKKLKSYIIFYKN